MIRNNGFFANKTAVISGASRGIGLAIAKKLACDGANIVILAKTVKDHPKLPGTIFSAAEEIRMAGGRCLPIECDIRDEQSARAAIQQTIRTFRSIDILVNNASAISLANTEKTDMKRFDLMQSVNARGTYMLTKLCLPYLKVGINPHVLNISPPLLMEEKWFKSHAAYTIAKYGMSMCVLAMSAEFREHGIAVNALWPRFCVWTAAMAMLKQNDKDAMRYCRRVEVISDAAYFLLQQPSFAFSGHFTTDEDVLKAAGINDLTPYAFDPEVKLIDDLFISGLEYEGPDRWGIYTSDNPISCEMKSAKL